MNPASGVFTFYVGRLFLMRFIALLLFFVIILQMLDLLNQSSDILAPDGASGESLWRYISLRAPQIASQFIPFAALLAIVMTLSGLSHTSEITIMRGAGMSIHRVLFPIGFVCLIIAMTHFIFHELVTVKTSEALDYWEANDYALNLPDDTGTRTNIRIRFDNENISAQSAARFGAAVLLTEVTIIGLTPDGLTRNVIEARAARHENGTWHLFGVTYLNAETLEVTHSEDAIWTNSLDPEFLFALTLKPDQTSLVELSQKIRQLGKDRADTREAMTSLLSRISKPMATLVMPLLGAIAGFGIHRQGVLLARAVSGASLGFTYFIGENLALALGKLGAMPAIISAFFPFALFMVIGFSILLAMEN
ncbi:MAG: LptF/LptG family permease [Shewanella sp.]|nr:LptF/LptG family permease [Shewanella sp.]